MNKDEQACIVNNITQRLVQYGYAPTFDDTGAYYAWRVHRADGSIVELVYDGGEEYDISEYDDENAYSVEDVRNSYALDLDTNPADAFIDVVEDEE